MHTDTYRERDNSDLMTATVTRYRPTVALDGEGGATETLGAGFPMAAGLQVYEGEFMMLFDADDDVDVGDIIAV